MKQLRALRRILALVTGGVASLIAACSSAPPVQRGSVAGAPVPAPQAAPGGGVPVRPAAPSASMARTPRDYRRDAATHLYQLNPGRIYAGRLPPMLYAVGVLEVDVDAHGRPGRLNWLRAPRHAPEVVAEIERMVRAAAPFPVPARLGRVTYTDTWLWDKSGRFQLDTLTEGQD